MTYLVTGHDLSTPLSGHGSPPRRGDPCDRCRPDDLTGHGLTTAKEVQYSRAMELAAILVLVSAISLAVGYQHGRRQEQIAERMRRLSSLRSPFYGAETYQDIAGASGTSWEG